MIFAPAEPDDHLFKRWVSSEGRWEIGFCRMMFGVRVRLGRVGWGSCELDYCAGADLDFAVELMRTVMIILAPIPEDVKPCEITMLFPYFTVKPINKDPHCWVELQRMADDVMRKSA
jgi:hypothetical protein